jgi:hypothetical protein
MMSIQARLCRAPAEVTQSLQNGGRAQPQAKAVRDAAVISNDLDYVNG